MHEDRLESNRPFRRTKVLAVLSLAALVLHAALLGELDAAGPASGHEAAPVATLQVRTLTDDRTEAALPVSPEVRLDVVPSVVPEPLPARAPAPLKPRAKAAPTTVAMKALAPMPVVEPLAVLAQETTPGADVPAATSPPVNVGAGSAGDEPVPVYRTRPPPAATLRYGMSRGMLHGNAELSWRPSGGQYELRLDGRIAGLTILSQVSQGGFDSAGLAPVRFTDQRLRGAMNAANFQRQAGKVTFSGPQTELALQRGVQDRLSWMVQLPAIVAAEPKLLTPGAKVSLHVIGARADAAVWVLRYVGRETIDVAGASVQAEKFSRVGDGPHDTAVDIWLDPQRHHLPARATLRNGGDGDALELELQELTPGT